ncbi:MAG: LytTR family DNA-binding domain-containing protein [Defluviitaleaceae bacterium]|nr:LytTR family DNA-binding domain-containing protein [Defluviitaleaceae bacterium]
MLSVFICEDNKDQLTSIRKCVDNYIFIENLNMEIVCAKTDPRYLINYISSNKVEGLYFLDIELNSDINGFGLAETIRKYDPRGFIVFVTADAESHLLTFEYKIEAMDYIIKGSENFRPRIRECVQNAYDKYNSKATNLLQTNFVFNLPGGNTNSVDISKIFYLETAQDRAHNLNLYTKDSMHQFRSSLKDVERRLSKNFFRCHRSYIVNINKVSSFNSERLEITLENGAILDVADKYVKNVRRLMNSLAS